MNISQTAGTVIVGAGQAGSELAFTLRKLGYTAPITLLGEEAYLPYRRPPLSKAFLGGQAELETLYLRPAAQYQTQNIVCRTQAKVERIDRAARRVQLAGGDSLPYDSLVLATGGRPRALELPGADAANVHWLATVGDAQRLREQLKPSSRVVIVGGGYIGLETAAVSREIGAQASVVEALPRVLARVTSPEVSAFYAAAHRRRGVSLHTDARVVALEGAGRVDTVVLDDGTRLPADLVVIAVGLLPETTLAREAGLAVDNGVLVDANTRSSDPAIYAIGDCAHHEHGFLGRKLRLECVSGAIDQARAAAAAICAAPAPAATVPWFWSDQYDLKLQSVGLCEGYDRVLLRGRPDDERFIAFYLSGDTLIAADAINSGKEFAVLRKLVAERASVDAALLADEGVALSATVKLASMA